MGVSEIDTLLDYCEGRRDFSEIDGYVGMEGSNRTMLLPNYITNTDSVRQTALLEALVTGALGRVPELEQYIGLLMHALMMLAISGHSDLIRFAKTSLEEEYADDQNVQAWLCATDNEAFPKGAKFKKTWHYAVLLGRVLHAIDSSSACKVTDSLRQHAVSPQLRAQLASLSS